jgi:hypothetical protein
MIKKQGHAAAENDLKYRQSLEILVNLIYLARVSRERVQSDAYLQRAEEEILTLMGRLARSSTDPANKLGLPETG